MNTTPVSQIRREARTIINKVIEDSVFGPVQCLPDGDVLELRGLFREAYPFGKRAGWKYKVWCSEVRLALGYPIKKAKRYEKPAKHKDHRVMPAMRDWAAGHGILLVASESLQNETPSDFSLQ